MLGFLLEERRGEEGLAALAPTPAGVAHGRRQSCSVVGLGEGGVQGGCIQMERRRNKDSRRMIGQPRALGNLLAGMAGLSSAPLFKRCNHGRRRHIV